MSSTAPSSDSPDDSGDSQKPEDDNNPPPKPDLSASLVTTKPSPQSPSSRPKDENSPPSQSSPPPTPTQPTPSPPPPEDDETPPPSSPPPKSPPPKSTPPPNSPPPTVPSPPPTSKSPPPATTSPPPSTSPPPLSPSPPPPVEKSGSSPPPPESSPPPAQAPPQNTPSQPPPPENSPSPPFVAPPNSGGNPVPSSPPAQPPPSSNHTPGTPSLPPPVPTASPSPTSIVPPPPAVVQPGHPSSTNNSSSNQPQISQSKNDEGLSPGATVAITLVVVSVFLGILGTIAFCVWNRKKRDYAQNAVYVIPSPGQESGNNSDSHLLKAQNSQPRNISGSGKGIIVYSPTEAGGFGNSRSWYTYEELVEATNGFSSKNLLGQGGFGFVYKGKLPDGRDVAVKQLKIGGGQGDREFRSEVEIISRIHHRHLVSLVGFCISENRRLLIYDYVPNNNLYFHLHGESRTVIDWAMRVKIAMGAARGIAYLHEDCHPRIIHRDIKSSNILLDENFEARVSDFGLAKLAKDTNTHVTTRVMGTFGYMAPEYASSGKLTEKSDVYSYGVVLLELITGRKPLDSSQDESLVEWARPLLTKSLETQNFEVLADPKLKKNYVDSEMFQMVEAAAACVRHSSAKRPKMGQVVRALDSIIAEDLTNGMKVGESELFNNSDKSAQINLFRKMAFGTQDYSIVDSWGSEGSEGNAVNSPRE